MRNIAALEEVRQTPVRVQTSTRAHFQLHLVYLDRTSNCKKHTQPYLLGCCCCRFNYMFMPNLTPWMPGFISVINEMRYDMTTPFANNMRIIPSSSLWFHPQKLMTV